MNEITKNAIAKYFKRLEKFGFLVFNFQSYMKMSKGTVGFPDLLILGKRYNNDIHFIEIKVGNDKLSEKQKLTKEYLELTTNYYIATDKNFWQIFDKILNY